MNRSTSITVHCQPGRHHADRATVANDRPLYVEEPDIPDGVTCAEWRRQRESLPTRGLLAHVRAWLRWQQFREVLS